jgi:hypothetical protein
MDGFSKPKHNGGNTMNKYIEELLTEMLFDFNDLRLGHTYKDVGYDTKAEFFREMSNKVEELYSRLQNEATQ